SAVRPASLAALGYSASTNFDSRGGSSWLLGAGALGAGALGAGAWAAVGRGAVARGAGALGAGALGAGAGSAPPAALGTGCCARSTDAEHKNQLNARQPTRARRRARVNLLTTRSRRHHPVTRSPASDKSRMCDWLSGGASSR